FYRFFERYGRITGRNFYELEAPPTRAPFSTSGGELLAEVARLRDQFLEHMDDDFNTGGAIGVLDELLAALNRFAARRTLDVQTAAFNVAQPTFEKGVVVLRELSQILGLFHEPPAASSAASDQLVGRLMQLLIDLRAEARKAKNFALGD